MTRTILIAFAALIAASTAHADDWSSTTITRRGNTSTWETISPRGVDIDVFHHRRNGTDMTTYHQDYGLGPALPTNPNIYGGNSQYNNSGGYRR